MEVRAHEQRLVVEHLLEVGNQPLLIHAVPRETTAEVVVHPAGSHRVERRGDHRACRRGFVVEVGPQEQLERHGGRELWCGAESAPGGVERLAELLHGDRHRVDGRKLRVGGNLRGSTDVLHQGRHVVIDVIAPVAPCIVDRGHELHERRLGVVSATEEWSLVWSEKHGHRPSTATRHRLHCIHVHAVHVGSLLTIHLHVDEQSVHHLCNLDILERLVGHHVAPVAGGISDRQQHRNVATTRLCEGLVAPGPPRHRIVAMLAKIGRGFQREAIHAGG